MTSNAVDEAVTALESAVRAAEAGAASLELVERLIAVTDALLGSLKTNGTKLSGSLRAAPFTREEAEEYLAFGLSADPGQATRARATTLATGKSVEDALKGGLLR